MRYLVAHVLVLKFRFPVKKHKKNWVLILDNAKLKVKPRINTLSYDYAL